MNPLPSPPILIPSRTAVLLVFLPPERAQRAAFADLAAFLQQGLGGLVRVLRVESSTHPEVVQSFGITHTPAFVLVRQGVELWRSQTPPDEATLAELARQLAES